MIERAVETDAGRGREVAGGFLRLVNESQGKEDLIRAAVTFFQEKSAQGTKTPFGKVSNCWSFDESSKPAQLPAQ